MSRRRKPETEAPWELPEEEMARVYVWALGKWPRIPKRVLLREWEKCRDYHMKHDIWLRNWEAGFRNWMRQAAVYAGQPEVKPKKQGELRLVGGRR